jgi:hypothetical protein
MNAALIFYFVDIHIFRHASPFWVPRRCNHKGFNTLMVHLGYQQVMTPDGITIQVRPTVCEDMQYTNGYFFTPHVRSTHRPTSIASGFEIRVEIFSKPACFTGENYCGSFRMNISM